MPYHGYGCSHSELDGQLRTIPPHPSLSSNIVECPHCRQILHLEDFPLANSQPAQKSKVPLNAKRTRTFEDGIRRGRRLQLEEDRIAMECYRDRILLLKDRILMERDRMITDVMKKVTEFHTELDDIYSNTDLGGCSSDERESISEDSSSSYEIDENEEEDDGEDHKGVIESGIGRTEDEGEFSSLEGGIDDENPGDEQGEESDVSSEDEDGEYAENASDDDDEISFYEQVEEFDASSEDEAEYLKDASGIHTNVIYVDADDDTSETDSQVVLYCGHMGFASNDDSDEEDDFNPDPTIEELAELMEEAHEPGNDHQLALVKRHIQLAERVVKDRRTWAQLYLLHHWRRNPLSLSLHRPTPELYVDASQHGIGLYLGTRWFAWTFIHGRPEIEYGPDGKIDASWAELFAVQIGIVVVLRKGYRNTPISIWSDNRGVVDALNRGTWTPNYNLDGILANILALCSAYGLVQHPKWIPSKVNPADKPSRGTYPPKQMMLIDPLRFQSRFNEFLARVKLD